MRENRQMFCTVDDYGLSALSFAVKTGSDTVTVFEGKRKGEPAAVAALSGNLFQCHVSGDQKFAGVKLAQRPQIIGDGDAHRCTINTPQVRSRQMLQFSDFIDADIAGKIQRQIFVDGVYLVFSVRRNDGERLRKSGFPEKFVEDLHDIQCRAHGIEFVSAKFFEVGRGQSVKVGQNGCGYAERVIGKSIPWLFGFHFECGIEPVERVVWWEEQMQLMGSQKDHGMYREGEAAVVDENCSVPFKIKHQQVTVMGERAWPDFAVLVFAGEQQNIVREFSIVTFLTDEILTGQIVILSASRAVGPVDGHYWNLPEED